MATLTVHCKRGAVTVEAGSDEPAQQVAARLADAISAAGGRKGERNEVRQPPTRDHQLQNWQLLECKRCRTWVKPTKFAAERHELRCARRATA